MHAGILLFGTAMILGAIAVGRRAIGLRRAPEGAYGQGPYTRRQARQLSIIGAVTLLAGGVTLFVAEALR